MATSDADYWMDLARYDLGAAKAMLEAKRRLYVGFLCHLATEKTLKAYWAQVKRSAPPFTHDLSMLAERTGLLAEMDERAKTIMRFLEPLHIAGRYPANKATVLRMLTPAQCSWLMKETRWLHRWIRNKLSEK
jgi:HEPN domain-containing protein